jgi:hypothetical protein
LRALPCFLNRRCLQNVPWGYFGLFRKLFRNVPQRIIGGKDELRRRKAA